MTTHPTDDWRSLTDWSEEVVARALNYYRAHASSVTEADVIRARELLARAKSAIAAKDAPAFRQAVTAYGAEAGLSECVHTLS